MWCATCQQDVAAPADADRAPLRCERCGSELANDFGQRPGPLTPSPSPTSGEGSKTAAATAPQLTDDWELEADLRSVERLIDSLKASGLPVQTPTTVGALSESVETTRISRRHDAHQSTAGWHVSASAAPNKSNHLAWTILSLALATFACGAVLLGWSLVAERDDLWPLGLPLALVGQAGLIIGLVLQLEGLWHSNRQTAETLSELDDELSRVRHATTLLTTTKNASAQSFYAHMAEGASPQLLLADLKGQLDLLAQQMASQRR